MKRCINFADCCRPIGLELWSVVTARMIFVCNTIHQMESNHQQSVLEMMAHSAAMFPIGPDGSVRSLNGNLKLQPRLPPAQELTGAFAFYPCGAPSAASLAVGWTDMFKSLGEQYSAEVSDATSLDSSLDVTTLAKSARCCAQSAGCGFVHSGQQPSSKLSWTHPAVPSAWPTADTSRRRLFLPGIRRGAELLRAHSATIEVGDAMSVAVPHASDSLLTPQLQSISCARSALWFGTVAAAGLAARKTPEEKHRRNRFARTALQHGYTRSWDILLAAWAEDDFTTMWFGTQSSPILTCFYSSATSSHFGMFQENRY